MQIVPITDRLFEISDIFSNDIIEKVLAKDWLSAPWKNQNIQTPSDRLRRSLSIDEDPLLIEVNNIIAELQPTIEDSLGIKFDFSIHCNNTNWWVDQPGFTVGTHTDGELSAAMQLYWISPNDRLGTFFTEFKNQKPYKQFLPRTNTGYIMLNGPNADGSQPLLWHGMLNPVPVGTFRVSSYTTFSPYTDK